MKNFRLIKLAKGAQSHEIRLYGGIHKSCFVEEATPVKIELEESTFRACFPSIVRDQYFLELRPTSNLRNERIWNTVRRGFFEEYYRQSPVLHFVY